MVLGVAGISTGVLAWEGSTHGDGAWRADPFGLLDRIRLKISSGELPRGRKRYVEWVAGKDSDTPERAKAWMVRISGILPKYFGAFADADFKTPRMVEGLQLGALSPREEHRYRVERLNETIIPKVLDGRYRRKL